MALTENYPPIDLLIPHRDRMKLVGEIVELTAESAITLSTVSSKWPLLHENKVDPLIIIELVAQTSAIQVSWKKGVHEKGGGGLLVGVKEVEFFVDSLSLGMILTTSVRDMYSFDHYTVLEGIVRAEDGDVGRVEIQVIRLY
jgi:predicted hotdog family 3-hydroxylacyl-ACP dehydratase